MFLDYSLRQEVGRMAKRYPTLDILPADTAVPLLAWLSEELGLSLEDMRSVSPYDYSICIECNYV